MAAANASVMDTRDRIEVGQPRTAGRGAAGERRRTKPATAAPYGRAVSSTRGTGFEGRDLQDMQERGVEAMETAQGESLLNEKDHRVVLDGGSDDTTGRTAMVRKRTGLHEVADQCRMDASERLPTSSNGGVMPPLEPSIEAPPRAMSQAAHLTPE